MYEIDPETGLLDKKFTLPISGDYPKDLVIFPDNQHIAIANHASNTITTFTVDYEKNIIVMNDKPHKIETPNCIHIYPIPIPPEASRRKGKIPARTDDLIFS